jgi:hypothetical protein
MLDNLTGGEVVSISLTFLAMSALFFMISVFVMLTYLLRATSYISNKVKPFWRKLI